VTGGLAAGKSTVCALLAAGGVPTVDADQLGRELTAAGGAVVTELARAFGDDVIDQDGVLRRDLLAARAFKDDDSRRRLEAIMHPRIAAAMAERLRELAADGHTAVVVEAALLLESGRRDLYDLLVVVTAPEAVRLARAALRGMSEVEARRRLAHQWPDRQKIEHADHVIENGGDRAALERRVARLLDIIRDRAEARQESR
jgi:dephospho-CoA kinase